MLVLDSGAVTRLSARRASSSAILRALVDGGCWPPVVPTVVLAESLRGDRRDAPVDRFLKTCIVVDEVPLLVARRAAELRRRARRGSVVDALVVALAEPGGIVLTGDQLDLSALASHADDVAVERL